jgi:protein-disulfide isomerase
MRQFGLLSVSLLSVCLACQAQPRTAKKSEPGAAAATPVTSGKSALDKTVFENYVRHLFVWGPQIQVKVSNPKPSTLPGFQQVTVVASAGNASQEETFLVSADGKNIIRGVVYEVDKNPFAAEQERIKTDAEPSFGPADAPVKLVIFSDFQCSFCKTEAQVVRQTLMSAFPTQVRVSFKDYPLEQIHPWARPAAIAGRCVFQQKAPAFWEYHDWIFENQAQITTENLKEKVLEFAKSKSLDADAIGACIDSKATEADVNRTLAEGRLLGVNSTPTMYVNGRKLVGQLPWAQLKSVIEHEIDYQKTHGDAKCCEVQLSSPVTK